MKHLLFLALPFLVLMGCEKKHPFSKEYDRLGHTWSVDTIRFTDTDNSTIVLDSLITGIQSVTFNSCENGMQCTGNYTFVDGTPMQSFFFSSIQEANGNLSVIIGAEKYDFFVNDGLLYTFKEISDSRLHLTTITRPYPGLEIERKTDIQLTR